MPRLRTSRRTRTDRRPYFNQMAHGAHAIDCQPPGSRGNAATDHGDALVRRTHLGMCGRLCDGPQQRVAADCQRPPAAMAPLTACLRPPRSCPNLPPRSADSCRRLRRHVRFKETQIIDEALRSVPLQVTRAEGPRLTGSVSDGTGCKTRWAPSPRRWQRCLHAILPP
jgi:hypothetical protein